MLIIFDWDGTLIDSAPMIIGAMQRAADELRMPSCSDDEVKEIIGLGLPEAIKSLFPHASDDERATIREIYARHFIDMDNQAPASLFPGVADTLAHLHAQGHTLAIATGKSRRGLDRVLQNSGLAPFFHGTRCADETRSKPDPLMLHELLHELSAHLDNAIMVGDTEYDMAMAKNAGMRRVAVSYGVHALERLQRYDPVHCVHHDLNELIHWVDQYHNK